MDGMEKAGVLTDAQLDRLREDLEEGEGTGAGDDPWAVSILRDGILRGAMGLADITGADGLSPEGRRKLIDLWEANRDPALAKGVDEIRKGLGITRGAAPADDATVDAGADAIAELKEKAAREENPDLRALGREQLAKAKETLRERQAGPLQGTTLGTVDPADSVGYPQTGGKAPAGPDAGTGPRRPRPGEILLAQADGEGSVTDEPPPISDAEVREFAKGMWEAIKSGDEQQLEGVRYVLGAYPDDDRKRIEEAVYDILAHETPGTRGGVTMPIAPMSTFAPMPLEAIQTKAIQAKDLTAEIVYDHVVKAPSSDSEEFMSVDWRIRQEAVLEALAELRDTDPEKFEQLQKDLQVVHANRDDWHARWGYPESILPPEIRDDLLREASRYRQMSDPEQHELFRRLGTYQGTDPEFYEFVRDEIISEAIGEDIIAGPKFFTDTELRERIENRKTAGLSSTAIAAILSFLFPPAAPVAQSVDKGVNAWATIGGMDAKEELKRRKRYRRNK